MFKRFLLDYQFIQIRTLQIFNNVIYISNIKMISVYTLCLTIFYLQFYQKHQHFYNDHIFPNIMNKIEWIFKNSLMCQYFYVIIFNNVWKAPTSIFAQFPYVIIFNLRPLSIGTEIKIRIGNLYFLSGSPFLVLLLEHVRIKIP